MNDLTPKQRLFVLEYRKDRNGTQSAIRAGYSEKGASVQASVLLANPKIVKYLEEQEVRMEKDLREMFADHAISAFNVLIDVMNNGNMDKDRLVAARDLLDRAGYKPKEQIEQSGAVGVNIINDIPKRTT